MVKVKIHAGTAAVCISAMWPTQVNNIGHLKQTGLTVKWWLVSFLKMPVFYFAHKSSSNLFIIALNLYFYTHVSLFRGLLKSTLTAFKFWTETYGFSSDEMVEEDRGFDESFGSSTAMKTEQSVWSVLTERLTLSTLSTLSLSDWDT